MSPFASACCHGPKLIASNLFWCSQCLKNFCGTHKHQVVLSKGPYLHPILPLKSPKPYKTTKNRWVLTFLRLKIVWPRWWLLCMPTDLNKCLTTYFDVLRALENFLSALERSLFISKFSFLNKFWQNFASGELLRPWNPKNHQVMTFSLLKTVSSIVWCRRLLLRVATNLN